MADEKIEEQQAEVEVPSSALGKKANQVRVRTDRYQRFYANNLAVEFSTWDMSIIFGEIAGEKDGQPVIEEIAHITMSREFAKTVTALLISNIKGFEKQFGEIKIPMLNESTVSGLIEEADKLTDNE